MNIGFIGLGNMGGPMAANLAAAGHNVTGFDTAEVSVEGVEMAASAAAAVHDQDVVITMLPNGQILPYNCTEEPWFKLLELRRAQLEAGEPVTATMADVYETEMYEAATQE